MLIGHFHDSHSLMAHCSFPNSPVAFGEAAFWMLDDLCHTVFSDSPKAILSQSLISVLVYRLDPSSALSTNVKTAQLSVRVLKGPLNIPQPWSVVAM
jgi:hypothetical protein